MATILVVEDHPHLLQVLADRLTAEGHRVLTAADGRAALDRLEAEGADLAICDLMLPRLDGWALTQRLRDQGRTLPLLVVTAREAFEDKKRSFLAGADDYMVKPIDLDELVLRVAALLRRAQIVSDRRIVLGPVVVDQDSLTVTTPTGVQNLAPKEFALLFHLLSHPQQIFTRTQLMDRIWGLDCDADERTVDGHVKKLRRRFEALTEFEIVTIRGLGYKAERRR